MWLGGPRSGEVAQAASAHDGTRLSLCRLLPCPPICQTDMADQARSETRCRESVTGRAAGRLRAIHSILLYADFADVRSIRHYITTLALQQLIY